MRIYKIARICLNGHFIGFDKRFEALQRPGLSHRGEGDPFCELCGAQAITACPSCKRQIRGEPDVSWMAADAVPPYSIPPFCPGCGRPYPWTERPLPEEKIKGIYEPGEEYAIYRDLCSLFENATREVFIIDAYLDEKVFNLYVGKVPNGATVRILSKKIGPNVATVAKMYSNRHPLQLRTSGEVHDRVIFVDQRGWVIGQSMKDAARSKSTYLIELEEPSLTTHRDIHNRIWEGAAVVVPIIQS